MLLVQRCFLLVFLPFSVLGKVFTTYAALGDSYASGNGAGDPIGILCARFSQAYPVQIANNLTLAFRNLACAGAFINTVLWTQVPWIGDSDVVTIEVGGNEADFFLLLNECVHQWFPLSTCDQEIARARSLIQSASFIERFDNLIVQAKKQAKPGTFMLVLGYARFFNDQTTQCNHVSFSKTNPDEFLTQAKRRAFNAIISLVNTVVQSAAEAHGVRYIDIDKVFEGHRFCEQGVIEPAKDASWFFNDLDDQKAVSTSSMAQKALSGTLGGFLELTRVFHPTSQGHSAIANEIIQILEAQ